MSDDDAWWYESSGERVGPVTLGELKSLVTRGAVTAQTRVWKRGTADWIVAASVRALFAPPDAAVPDFGMRMLLPVGRSGLAIAAGYCGLFGFIPFVSLLALVFSTLAVADLRKHPHKIGWGRVLTGYILGALFTAFYAWALLRH